MPIRTLDITFRRELLKIAIQGAYAQLAAAIKSPRSDIDLSGPVDGHGIVETAYKLVAKVEREEATIFVQNEIDACNALSNRLYEMQEKKNPKGFYETCAITSKNWAQTGSMVLMMVASGLEAQLLGKGPAHCTTEFIAAIVAMVDDTIAKLETEMKDLKKSS